MMTICWRLLIICCFRIGSVSPFRFFERPSPDKIQPRMQYDYVQAYLDFYTGDIERFGRIASEYLLEYSVPRWRNMFRHIANQLDELEGKAPEVAG